MLGKMLGNSAINKKIELQTFFQTLEALSGADDRNRTDTVYSTAGF